MSRETPLPRTFLRGAAVAVAVLVTGTGCTPLDDVMVAVFGRGMRDSRSYDPYENPRIPAENSVPFASGNYPATMQDVGMGQPEGLDESIPDFTAQDMARGGEVAAAMENPVPADEASLARGRDMYNRYCAVCHGPAGMSAEAPIAPKLPLVQAFNLATGNSVGFSDGYIYGMIRVGRGAMPAYGHRITHFDRWHIVNYVRELQGGGGGGAAPAAAPDAASQDTAAASQDTAAAQGGS